MSQEVLASHPELGARLHDLLQKAVDLLGLPPELAEQRKLFTRPSPGQLTFELPQIAHYMPGRCGMLCPALSCATVTPRVLLIDCMLVWYCSMPAVGRGSVHSAPAQSIALTLSTLIPVMAAS
jgi:hypothetical protein